MMPHPQKTFGAESAKAYTGSGGLRQYFAVKPKSAPLIMGRGCGHPSKKRKTHLALGDEPVNMLEGEEQQDPPPAANGLLQKNMHINWRKGGHRDLMEKAIHDWRKMVGNINNIKACCKCYKFSKSYGIPHPNFLQVRQT
jgi:hypothetical protein